MFFVRNTLMRNLIRISEACRQRASALLALGDLEDAQTAARAA